MLPVVQHEVAGWQARQRYLRGLFAGGTFCYQAQQVLREALAKQLGRVAPQAFPFPATRCDRVVAGVMARILGGTD